MCKAVTRKISNEQHRMVPALTCSHVTQMRTCHLPVTTTWGHISSEHTNFDDSGFLSANLPSVSFNKYSWTAMRLPTVVCELVLLALCWLPTLESESQAAFLVWILTAASRLPCLQEEEPEATVSPAEVTLASSKDCPLLPGPPSGRQGPLCLASEVPIALRFCLVTWLVELCLFHLYSAPSGCSCCCSALTCQVLSTKWH